MFFETSFPICCLMPPLNARKLGLLRMTLLVGNPGPPVSC